MKDIMLDIETLDTKPSAVVLSIAAVRFDIHNEGSISDEFHAHIDIQDSLSMGRTVSGSTILWWLGQEVDARMRVAHARREPVKIVLERLAKFIKSDDRVWGNGAAFDNVIMSSLFNDAGIAQPWRFYNDRCFRTLKNMHANVTAPEFAGVQHDALDDAIHQARHLQRIYQAVSANK